MTDIKLRSQGYFKGLTWNLWSSYWLSVQDVTPPLVFLREGADNDLFFVTALTREEVSNFITASKADYELLFREQGQWALDPTVWFGHWTCFTASPRQAFTKFVRGVAEITDH